MDRRTDGQTDGIAIAYARLAYKLSRAKNGSVPSIQGRVAAAINEPGTPASRSSIDNSSFQATSAFARLRLRRLVTFVPFCVLSCKSNNNDK